MTSKGRAPLIGVIGAGAWGMNHVRVWEQLGRLQVVADPDPNRLAVIKDRHPSVEMSGSWVEVLDRDDISGVVVATPAVMHAQVALEAIRRGKDVLVEKPLALDVNDGESLVKEAEGEGRVLMVGHVLEYHPAVLALRRIVENGDLGRLRYLYSNRLNFGRLRSEENAMWSFAPHDLALFLRILRSSPTEVVCHGGAYLNPEVLDVNLMSLTFPGGIRGHIFVSWLHPFKEHRLVVVGDRQMASFNDSAPWPEKLQLYPHAVEWVDGRVPLAQRAEAVAVDVEGVEPLVRECEEFLECIATRRSPLTDGASGVEVVRLLEAGERSLRSGGQPVKVGSVTGESRAFVHPSAVVDDGAVLGAGTRVWHWTHVMAGARIGQRCVLGQNVFVGQGTTVGDRVKVQNNVSIYEGVELEDDVFCGPSAVFTNVMNPRSELDRRAEFRPTLVRRGATLGANSTIVCGTTVGRYAFVAAGAAVVTDVPDYALVAGVPARFKGWMCRCGNRLELGGNSAVSASCSSAYTLDADGSLLEVDQGGDVSVP